MPTTRPCPFCSLPDHRITACSEYGVVIRDVYPVSPGHTLIIPKRHIGSFFDLFPDERTGLLKLLDEAKKEVDQK